MPARDDIPQDRSVLGRLAGASFKRRRSVLVGWVVVVALAVVASMTLGGEYGVDYATPGSESKAAAETLAAEYGGRSDESVDIVYASDASVTDAAVTGPVDELLARAGELEGLTGGMTTADAEVSPDGRTAVVSVPLDRLPDSVPPETGASLSSMAEGLTTSSQTVAVGGAEVGQVVEAAPSSELIGIGVAALVLLATFGGAIAAGLPLVVMSCRSSSVESNVGDVLDHEYMPSAKLSCKRFWLGLAVLVSLVLLFPVPLVFAALELQAIPQPLRPTAVGLGLLSCFSLMWTVTWKTWAGVGWFKPRGNQGTSGKMTVVWFAGTGFSMVGSTLLWRYGVGWSWMQDGYVEALELLVRSR